MAITLSNDKGQKTSPRNLLGLANSKTNRSSSDSLYDEPRRHTNHVSVCVPEGASRQVQKKVCPPFHRMFQEKKKARGKGKRGLFKPWQPHLADLCGLGGG